MFSLSKTTANWEKRGKWVVAPTGLPWISQGSHLQVGKNVRMAKTAFLDKFVILADNCAIEEFAFIGAKCYIGEGTVIADRARVGRDTRINTAVLVDSLACIGIHCILGECCHIYQNVVIGDFGVVNELEIVTDSQLVAN